MNRSTDKSAVETRKNSEQRIARTKSVSDGCIDV